MKLTVVFCVLSLAILSVNATQWKVIKSPMDSFKYKEILEKLYRDSNVTDEKKITGKITNGSSAELGQFPFQVYMYLYEGTGVSYLCGGSVRKS